MGIMKRLRRLLLNAVTSFLIMLLAVTIGAWIRSQWVAEFFRWGYTEHIDPETVTPGSSTTFSRGIYVVVAEDLCIAREGDYFPYSVPSNADLGSLRQPEPAWTEGFAHFSGIAPRVGGGTVPLGIGTGRWSSRIWQYAGVSWTEMGIPQRTNVHLDVSYITLVVLLGLIPAVRLLISGARLRRRHRRIARGLCRTCGYDLRASPDRCPECGTIVNAPGKF